VRQRLVCCVFVLYISRIYNITSSVRLSCYSEDRIELEVGIKVTYDELGKETRLLKLFKRELSSQQP
jgi:hypothetical protein